MLIALEKKIVVYKFCYEFTLNLVVSMLLNIYGEKQLTAKDILGYPSYDVISVNGYFLERADGANTLFVNLTMQHYNFEANKN